MNITNISAWIKKDTKLEPASVPMAFRIGQCTFFLSDDAKGLEKLTELIEMLQVVRLAGAASIDEFNRKLDAAYEELSSPQEIIPQEVDDMELIEDGE